MRVALGLVVGMACVGRPEKGTADPPVADSDPPVVDTDPPAEDSDPPDSDPPVFAACEDPNPAPPDVAAAVVVTACALTPGRVVALDLDNAIDGPGAVGPVRVAAVRGALEPGRTAIIAWSGLDRSTLTWERQVWPATALAFRGLGAPAVTTPIVGALDPPHAVAVIRGVNGAPCRLFEEVRSEGVVPRPGAEDAALAQVIDLPVGSADPEVPWFEDVGVNDRQLLSQAWSDWDVTGDGAPDLVLVDSVAADGGLPYVDVIAGPAPAPDGPRVAELGHREGSALSLAIGDFDGDGVGDLAWSGQDPALAATGRIRMWLGPLAGRHESVDTDLPGAPRIVDDAWVTATLSAGDLDGDGVTDLLVSPGGRADTPEVWVFYGPVGRVPLDAVHADARLVVPADGGPVSAVVVDDLLGGPGPDLVITASGASQQAFDDRLLPPDTVGVGWLVDGDVHGEVDVGDAATWIGPSDDGYGSVLWGAVFPLGDLNGDGAADLGLGAARLDPSLPYRVGVVLGCPRGLR